MHIVARASLLSFMTGSFMDPQEQFQLEMRTFAEAILADSTAEFFVYTDNENGDDVTVSWEDESSRMVDVVPLREDSDNGYYGMTASRREYGIPEDPRVIYNCYVGGSQGASAPGFVITTAAMA